MALVTQHIQGSHVTFPSRPLPWNRGMKLKRYVTTLHMVARTDRFHSSKCQSCLSLGAPIVRGLKGKSLRISAFKGSAQNDESGGRTSGSKSAKKSVKLSYVEREDEETLKESPVVQNVPLSHASEAEGTIAGSMAIQNLFKNWLTLLRTQTPNEVADEILEEPAPTVSGMENGSQKTEGGEILKAVWCYFLGLDATVKIPLLIFIPFYMVVNMLYGAEVSKELTPLWVLGPLIVALYIKMFRGLCALYVFSFKQTVKVIKSIPGYSVVALNYIARGKLKEDLRARFWQPVVDIKNLDYKELSKRKLKDLKVWAGEYYLDFVESIWPYYCRTIRFLKRANLI
ncbi:uncharacterized protein LOC132304320 [Cornus florida]|uniref:uncharacterized protein LOC132304320 n=1 Tax=Cornus florida TaxID=4283 RepID=UPI00289E4180|nr:uncharacterized protein LOC132304320 [Cornus florida]